MCTWAGACRGSDAEQPWVQVDAAGQARKAPWELILRPSPLAVLRGTLQGGVDTGKLLEIRPNVKSWPTSSTDSHPCLVGVFHQQQR